MNKLKSRKFIMAVVGSLIVLANQGFDMNLPEATITQFVSILVAYILGESAVDMIGSRSGRPK